MLTHAPDNGELSVLKPEGDFANLMVFRCEKCKEAWAVDVSQLAKPSSADHAARSLTGAAQSKSVLDQLGEAYPDFFEWKPSADD